MPSAITDHLVDSLFRKEAGRMVARLARRLGPDKLQLAEDSVQDAMMRALHSWPYKGIPDSPAAWLWRVAQNAALDRLRKDSRGNALEQAPPPDWATQAPPPETAFDTELTDDRLALIFACSHPAIAAPARLALTLKTACGFGVREIAAALLVEPETVAQRLVRARKRLKKGDIALDVPTPDQLAERLPTVLDTLYLLFNEGFAASEGDALLRRDLCEEAMDLAQGLADHPLTGRPDSHALAALLLFHGARFDARVDGAGDLILLQDQNRALWDQDRIAAGFRRLQRAQGGDRLTEFHLLAGIAACHAAAPTFAATQWHTILDYYDRLPPTPVNRLNRAVAVAMIDGPEHGLSALDAIKGADELRRYYLLPATRGELLRRLGRADEAVEQFRCALDLAASEPVRRFLRAKLA
jgi:RNA polymerase sigma factor (sigma-70 family)